MKKRITAIVCILTAVVTMFCSCKLNQTDEEQGGLSNNTTQTVNSYSISLPYSSADSLNPYYATGTENLALAYLFCQPLYTVKSDYSAQAVLAAESEYSENTVSVTLNSAQFSDGTSVSEKDVVYSFNKAKQSSAFSQRLSNVVSAYAKGDKVVFELSKADILYKNILTFPIVKNATAESETTTPIGSGAFVFESGSTLTACETSQNQGAVNKIILFDVKKLEYIANAVEIGNINYLFEDFSDGEYNRIAAQNKAITLNNIVYLGMNRNVPALSSSAIRTALYYAIDKEAICQSAYQGYAKAAVTPFNPDFYMLDGLDLPSRSGDAEKSDAIFSKMGYNYYTKKSIRTNQVNELSFSLLVNSDNEFRCLAADKIAAQLSDRGISVTLEKVDSATYKQRIASGNYQLYLGEIKLCENFDLSPFISGAASIGTDNMSQFNSDYEKFESGEIGIEALIESFYNDMPFIPICYRQGMAAYSKGYTPDFSYAPFDIYAGISEWINKDS